jgi:hypothetical protein
MFITARHFLLLGVLILLGINCAQANIGEDLTQLRERYGKEKIIAGQWVFEHDGLSVTVYVDGDRSGMEIFTHNTSIPSKAELTQKDIDTILAAEGDGQIWNPVQVHSGKPTWVRTDGKVMARYSPNMTGKPDDASVLVIMVTGR